MSTTNTLPVQIEMTSADPYRLKNYGVLLESVARYSVAGRGFHNPHHNHTIEVWFNREGQDPHGRPTPGDQPYTVLMSAKASVISTMKNTNVYGDETLHIGDAVDLYAGDYLIGKYVIEARPLCDPYLVPRVEEKSSRAAGTTENVTLKA